MTHEPNSACLGFSELADQWLLAYASLNATPSPVTLFLVGHCLESYCKSVLLRDDPICNVVGFSHNIEKMIEKIKTKVGLLQNIHFLPQVEERFMTRALIPVSETNGPDYEHYILNQELYWTAKFQKELKYLGTQGKRMPAEYAVLVMNRNPFWIPILSELRLFARRGLNQESPTISNYRSLSYLESPERAYVELVCGSES